MRPHAPDPYLQQYEAVLQSIETAVIRFFKQNPALTDHQIDKAYEALQRGYESQIRGKNPPRINLKPLEQALYEALLPICESWLREGQYTDERRHRYQIAAPVPLADMVTGLKRLRRSISLWTRKTRGRQGYLDYIGEFVS